MKLPRFEYLYCFWSLSFPLCAKIGYSIDWRRRRAEVQAELRTATGREINVYCIMLAPMLYARQNEFAIHSVFARLKRYDMPKHCGRNEWYWGINFVSAILAYIGIWYSGRDDVSGWLLAVLFAPVPLDFIICIVLLAVVQYSLIGLFFYVAYQAMA